jgi:lysozyme
MRFSAELYERALAAVRPAAPEPEPTRAAEPQAPFNARAVAIAVRLCKAFEGFSAAPYLCPAGKPTIGWGATFYLDGRPVSMRDKPISQPVADRLLEVTLMKLVPQVLALCPAAGTTPERLAALLSFAFNLGIPRLRASTLRRAINARDWSWARREIKRWVYADGKRLAGRVRRREAEAALL